MVKKLEEEELLSSEPTDNLEIGNQKSYNTSYIGSVSKALDFSRSRPPVLQVCFVRPHTQSASSTEHRTHRRTRLQLRVEHNRKDLFTVHYKLSEIH